MRINMQFIEDAEKVAHEEWPMSPNFRVRLATWIASHAPRGRGAIPRFIGRYFGVSMKTSIRTHSGAYLAVEPSSLDVYAAIGAAGGFWEPRVLRACLSAVRSGDVFYDIGANVGFMSIEVATRLGESVSVFAFEPIPVLAQSVLRSAFINGARNIHVLPIMLGSIVGEAELFIPSHSIHSSAISRQRSASKITCPMTTLDQLVQNEIVPPPDVIKIDVEGGELDVFRGAIEVVKKYAPIIIFEADVNMRRFGYSLMDLMAILSATIPYEFFGVGRNNADLELVRPDEISCTEFIAVPPSRTVR